MSVEEFAGVLVKNGWIEDSPGQFVKGTWRIIFDTSSWLVLANPRTIDVAVPDEYHSRWTVNLIQHLLWSEEELHRLRAALNAIGTDPPASQSVQSSAAAALADQNPRPRPI
jgi:hypothetical protein